MKTAIVTLPLHTNYGGLLQAFALKNTLESLGHQTDVLDLRDKMQAPKGLRAPFVYTGRILKRLTKGSAGPEVFREMRYRRELPILSANTGIFVQEYIAPRVLSSYSQIREGEYDAFVVGSDQVWRPKFFNGIENAFLAFTEGWDVRRVSYAASFGTDQLEYEYLQLETCAKLLEKFDGVSVREDSAVKICEEWLDYDDAVHVLDPVMLLNSEIYRNIASDASEHNAKGRIMTYILDPSAEKSHVIGFVSRVSGMEVQDVSVTPYTNDRPVEERIVPPVENWLAAFVDADFVITDSFHACVLSILLHKRFIAVGNSYRGMARLRSLLKMFNMDSRLVQGIDPEDDLTYFMEDEDWEAVDRILDERRSYSLEFLKNALGQNENR